MKSIVFLTTVLAEDNFDWSGLNMALVHRLEHKLIVLQIWAFIVKDLAMFTYKGFLKTGTLKVVHGISGLHVKQFHHLLTPVVSGDMMRHWQFELSS